MSQRTIGVTEVALRDAHQSLMATRMALEDMVDACADIDAAGYWSVECWGGATYDSCIRFLNEDPWVRLRTFRELLPNSKLQMLLRGQNLLGYRHYEDDVVRRFVDASAENGMDVFRVFDALNDPRNMEVAMKAVTATGKHAQGTICYTISPLHTVEGYVKLAGQLLDMGAESLALKDMAALLQPQPAYDIIRGIKSTYGEDTQINVHCHATTGVTLVTLMKAIEAGADVVDTAISSMSLGPGHNPTESLVAMLGFVIAGVPGITILTVATFFFSMVPVIGATLIWGGAAVWLYETGQTGWAIFMVLWGMFGISSVDNFLKPILISRTSSLPLLLIVVGVFGGVLVFGFIGLFLGPTLLALGQVLIREWLEHVDYDESPSI